MTTGNSPFEQSRATFRGAVIALLHPPDSELKINPSSTEANWFWELKAGDMIPFEAQYPTGAKPAPGVATVAIVHGYADGKQAVLPNQQELGPIFAAAHFLDEKSDAGARKMAERIIWLQLVALGQPSSPAGPQPPNHRLVESGGSYATPAGSGTIGAPAIEHRPDGSAALIFYYSNLESIGAGLVRTHRAEIACSKNYQVTISHIALLTMR